MGNLDGNNLRPWLPGQAVEAARLQAMQEQAVTAITVGPGLVMTRLGNKVMIGMGEQPPQPAAHVWVQIVDELTGDGAYRAIIGRPSGTPFDPASDGATGFFTFTPPEGETFNAYFVNYAEENKTPHWLDTGGHYPGWIEGIASDGLPVVLAHVFDTLLCEEEEA